MIYAKIRPFCLRTEQNVIKILSSQPAKAKKESDTPKVSPFVGPFISRSVGPSLHHAFFLIPRMHIKFVLMFNRENETHSSAGLNPSALDEAEILSAISNVVYSSNIEEENQSQSKS